MDLLGDLEARGLVKDHTDRDALAARLASGPVTLYHGIDPTADSLHVGNLIGLLVLRRFQDAGHRPLALAGGATGMVGDPSGRSSERNLLDADTLDHNLAAIKAQMAGLLGDVPLVDNRDWTAGVTLLDFLRDVGKHVSVNTMLARESVRQRMDAADGISFTEFTYMLLQANDYLHLADAYGCELQVGGSDQFGNILAGVDLIRRTRGRTVHALSWPLLTAPDGTKLGKTAGARIWLDPARTSAYRFYQHWMHTDDLDVRRCLAQFTLLPLEEVDSVAAAGPPEAQRRLALEVTTLVHGAAAAADAKAASEVLFGGPAAGLSPGSLAMVAEAAPTLRLARAPLAGGYDVVDLLVDTGAAASRSEARRLLGQGGIALNGHRLGAEPAPVGEDALLHGRFLVLRRGKQQFYLVDVGDGTR